MGLSQRQLKAEFEKKKIRQSANERATVKFSLRGLSPAGRGNGCSRVSLIDGGIEILGIVCNVSGGFGLFGQACTSCSVYMATSREAHHTDSTLEFLVPRFPASPAVRSID